MTNTFIRNDPVKALQYFEDKMAFTTGPIELNWAINEKQDIVVVDVRAAEDFKEDFEFAPRQVGQPSRHAQG